MWVQLDRTRGNSRHVMRSNMPDYGFGRCDDHHKIADFYSSTVHRTVILRETSPDFLGNPAGRLRGSRNRLSEAVICALLRDFSKHGEKAIAKVRRTQPAAYLKICALLVPKEMKLEHTNPLSSLSDEELDQALAALRAMLAQLGEAANVIEGT